MKKLHKIGHVISELNITARTIRYYDQLGILPEVKRSEGSVRLFDNEDIKLLKQILRYKAEEKSLDQIKALITNSASTESIHIVTDQISYHHKKSDSISVIPIDIQSNKMSINPTLSTFWSSIYTKKWVQKLSDTYEKTLKTVKELNPDIVLYLYASHGTPNHHKEILENLKTQHQTVIPYAINSFGFSSTLLIDIIDQNLNNKISPLDHTAILSQQKNMPHEIICLNSLDYQLTGQTQQKSKTSFSKFMRPLFPVFQSNDTDIALHDCAISEEETIEYMVELFLKELHLRANYVQKITISYAYHYRIAETLEHKLKDHVSSDKLSVIEASPLHSLEFGERFVCIAIT